MKFRCLLIPGFVPSQHSFWLRQEIPFEELIRRYALQSEDCKEGTQEIFFSEKRVILRVRHFDDYLEYKARRLDRCCQSCGEINHTFLIPDGMWKCRTCGNEWKRRVA